MGDEYLRRPNDKDVARLLVKNEQQDFFEILDKIDCSIGSGRIIQLVSKVCIHVMFMNQLSYWKQLLSRTCVFGTFF